MAEGPKPLSGKAVTLVFSGLLAVIVAGLTFYGLRVRQARNAALIATTSPWTRLQRCLDGERFAPHQPLVAKLEERAMGALAEPSGSVAGEGGLGTWPARCAPFAQELAAAADAHGDQAGYPRLAQLALEVHRGLAANKVPTQIEALRDQAMLAGVAWDGELAAPAPPLPASPLGAFLVDARASLPLASVVDARGTAHVIAFGAAPALYAFGGGGDAAFSVITKESWEGEARGEYELFESEGGAVAMPRAVLAEEGLVSAFVWSDGSVDGVRSTTSGYAFSRSRPGAGAAPVAVALTSARKPIVLRGALASTRDEPAPPGTGVGEDMLVVRSISADGELGAPVDVGRVPGGAHRFMSCSSGASITLIVEAGLAQERRVLAFSYSAGEGAPFSSPVRGTVDAMETSIACDASGSTVAWVLASRSLAGASEWRVSTLRCSRDGCRAEDVALEALGEDPMVGTVGDDIVLVWRGARGALWARRAPLEGLAQAPSTLLTVSRVQGGVDVLARRVISSEAGALLLLRTPNGMHALRFPRAGGISKEFARRD